MRDKIIEEAAAVLLKGGLIIYPTETCYGVGVIATNEKAVAKLLEYKRRPEGKPISIAVSSKEMADEYVFLNAEAEKIYKEFLPGPVTLISKSKDKVAFGLEAENNTLGIRIPDFDMIIELINKVGLPITATSANSSGKKTPYSVQDIYDNISEKQKAMIDYVVDFGELPHNPPSTVIDTTKHGLQIVRHGQVSLGTLRHQAEISSVEEMIEEGEKLVVKYRNLLEDNCLLIMFNAELGAGKTHFVKGMANGLKINEIVKSPTYSLLQEYPYEWNGLTGSLVHFDAWRLESLDELDALDLESYIMPKNVVAVEWAGATEEYFERISHRKNLYTVQVQIEYISQDKRRLTIYETK